MSASGPAPMGRMVRLPYENEGGFTCGGCKFFAGHVDQLVRAEPWGECRLRAPQMVTAGPNFADGVWPMVSEKDWCGEGRPRRSAE